MFNNNIGIEEFVALSTGRMPPLTGFSAIIPCFSALIPKFLVCNHSSPPSGKSRLVSAFLPAFCNAFRLER